MNESSKNVLEQNVSTLIETGGEPPRLADAARTRIKSDLVAKFAAVAAAPAPARLRMPMIAVGLGLAAAAGIAVVATKLVGSSGGDATVATTSTTLADGTTYIAEAGAKVRVLGPRRIRVDGAALLDVAPGKGTFVVETSRGTIEVLGTRFLVDGQADRTTAAVVRGEVKLATSNGDVVLHAGEQGVAEPGRAPTRGPAPRLSHLVSWAQQARHAEEHDLQPIHHGSLFARDPGVRSHPPWGEEYPLPIKQLTLDVVVDNQVARVALDQTFHNDATQDLEGVYRFAIPPDAALQRLAMYVDGKLEESAVVERMQARRIYEELVYRRVDPALLEWAGNGRLSLRVYPLPAQQDKRLMLSYTQSLPKLYDDWTLTVPLPEVDQPVGDMDVAVRVKGCAGCELASTSHQVTIERTGDDAIVKYHHGGEKLGDSFVLHVRDARHLATVAEKREGDEQFMMVRAPLELGHTARAYKPRTWIVLDDVSASRGVPELRAQRDLIDAFVRELDENDKLAVFAFDVQARQKLGLTRVMDVDRKGLRKALGAEGGVGATDFQAALDAATKALAGIAPEDAMIVYLGDGLITSGPHNLDALRAQIAGKAHFIGVGVGDGPDTQTLGNLASATGGYATTMDLADDLGWRAFDLIAALHTSRVTGLEAKLVDAGGTLVPATAYLDSQQLADGEELELVAKLAGTGTPVAVELTGTMDGAAWHQRIALGTKATGDTGYLPRLWAQRHIAARLLVKHEPVALAPCALTKDPSGCPSEAEAREARDEQIRREVVGLGKKYFLLSRHTSLLVLENDDMYKKYDVVKGSGETWARYAMPATIPVVKTAAPATGTTPANVATDAELVRTPLQVFYNNRVTVIDTALADGPFQQNMQFHTRFGADLQQREHASLDSAEDTLIPVSGETGGANKWGTLEDAKAQITVASQPMGATATLTKDSERRMISTDEIMYGVGHRGIDRDRWGVGGKGRGGGGAGGLGWLGDGQLAVYRLTYPNDVAFDDLTGFVPGLFADGADALRAQLGPSATHVIDDAARTLLTDARKKLATGVYRWGDRELAIDDARHLGWRRTTDDGLLETASFDGATLTRRYAELGLDVTRPIADDDVALSLAFLPVWIADPAHYAKYFDVSAHGRDVTLSTMSHGKARTVFVLAFDDQSRLVSIRDARHAIVEIAWTSNGPMSARVNGETISIGFTGQAIADAAAWAHRDAKPGTVVELPGHLLEYWQKRVAAEPEGTPAWRHAQRQLMVSAAATQNRGAVFAAYEALRTHGGVELGDLVLGSGGLTSATDAQLATALAPFAQQPVARYLAASRAYAKQAKPAHLTPETRDGFLGALWQLRSITARLAATDTKGATDELATMTTTAPELRIIAASAANNHYELKVEDAVRMWDAVAVGPYKNVARAMAAQMLFNRGQYEAGADRLAKLVDDLDLDATPPRLENMQYMFNNTRRGTAGWEIVYASLRNRVLAGSSYAHVMALLPLAAAKNELPAVLARAADLAGDDPAKQLEIAATAVMYNQTAFADSLVKPMLAKTPTRELYQLAAAIAQRAGKLEDALVDLEHAQDAGSDEPAGIATVRAELGQIIATAGQLAMQTRGVDRDRAIEHAMTWGGRWRAIDPGNTEIDRQLGEMLLAIGDSAGAWRQLSSTIERDPWTGTGYMTVAEAFERQGKVAEALPFWQQAIVIDQTNPTPRLRKAQALIALGRSAEGDQLLKDITSQKWHDVWSNVVYQANDLIQRGKQPRP